MGNFRKICRLLIWLSPVLIHAQGNRTCIDDVLLFEESYSLSNDSLLDKTIYFNYSVKVIDWDDETTVSNVKLYRNKENIHMFSEQATMMNDSKEVLLILPSQQVIVRNSYDKKLNSLKQTDQLIRMRKTFLDSCEVVKCETKTGNVQILVLKAKPGMKNTDYKIATITYEYDSTNRKILSVKTEYTGDYKMKQMTITYNSFGHTDTYKFYPVRSYVTDKKGNLLGKYKTYELVDNRDYQVAGARDGKSTR